MGVSSGFYDSLNGDRKYNIRQLSSIFDGIITDGVYSSIGKHFTVRSSEPNNMTVVIGSGRAWYNHTWTLNDADVPMTIDPSDSIFNRWDAIVLDVNNSHSVRKNTIQYIAGEAASKPIRPVMITDDLNSHYQHPLAYIYVSSGATKITDSDITNVVGTAEAPFVTGVLSTVTTDELVQQWEARFDILLGELQKQIDQVLQGTIPDGSVSSTYNTTLYSNNWMYNGNDYRQTVQVPGLKKTDHPVIDISMSNIVESKRQEILSEWSPYMMLSNDGSLDVRFESKPNNDIPIQMLCVRK